jgi:hypothetical protein
MDMWGVFIFASPSSLGPPVLGLGGKFTGCSLPSLPEQGLQEFAGGEEEILRNPLAGAQTGNGQRRPGQ